MRNIRKAFVLIFALCCLLATGCTIQASEQSNFRPVSILIVEDPSQPIDTQAPVIVALGEQHNMDLHVKGVSKTIYHVKKDTMLSLGNLPDITQVTRNDIDQYARKGLFLPLNEYLHLMPNFSKILADNPEMERLYVDGVLYGFPKMTRNGIYAKSGAVIRYDLLKQVNVALPRSFDELYSVLKHLKISYPDSTPWVVKGGTGSLLSHIAYAMGSGYSNTNDVSNAYGLYFDKDVNQSGKYTFAPLKEEFKDILIYLNRMYEEGILDPNYNITSGDEWLDKILTGKSFFFFDNTNSLLGYQNLFKVNNPDAELVVLDRLRNQYGYTRTRFESYHNWEVQYVIAADVENPEEIIALIDYMYSEEGAMLTNYGIEGVHYEMVSGKPKVNDELIHNQRYTANPYKSMQSVLGTGSLSFCTYIDDTPIQSVYANCEELFEMPNHYHEAFLDPPLNETEVTRLNQLKTKIDKILLPEMDKMIMGITPFDDYDNVIRALEKEGAKEVETIYNQALVRYYGLFKKYGRNKEQE